MVSKVGPSNVGNLIMINLENIFPSIKMILWLFNPWPEFFLLENSHIVDNIMNKLSNDIRKVPQLDL